MNKLEFIEKGYLLFNEEINKLGLNNVSIKFINSPKKFYAKNIPSKDFRTYRIEINLYQFFKNKRNNEIYLYKNIIHELEHVKTLAYPQNENYYNHDHIYSLLEYMSMINKNSFYKDHVLKLNLKYRIELSQLMIKNYQFSKSEILANLVSLQKMVDKYHDLIPKEELQSYLFLIDIYTILKDMAILRYDVNRNAINGLYITYGAVKYFIKKNPEIINNFKSLNIIYHEDGEYKDIYELYNNINEDNKDLIENTIINLMLINKYDLSPYMNDINFKNYLSDIIANYNNKVFMFYNNFNKINELFTRKNKKNNYLYYNYKLLKTNVLVLADYINRYGLEIKSGMIIDNSAVPNVLRKDRKKES